MGVHQNLTGAQRVAKRRAALRAQGLRLKQFWVPDLRDPRVRAEIERGVALINASDRRDGVMDFVDSLNDETVSKSAPCKWDDEQAP